MLIELKFTLVLLSGYTVPYAHFAKDSCAKMRAQLREKNFFGFKVTMLPQKFKFLFLLLLERRKIFGNHFKE